MSRDERRSWHWYAHGVPALEGNEHLPAIVRPHVYHNDDELHLDADSAHGFMSRKHHRANAAIGVAWRKTVRS